MIALGSSERVFADAPVGDGQIIIVHCLPVRKNI